MELFDAMRTTPSCRYFTDRPVPDDVIDRVLDNARFASSGGNRQGWRIIVCTDPTVRTSLAELYLRQWDPYLSRALDGASERTVERLERTDEFAQHLNAVPVLLVCYVELATLAITDKDLDRPSIVGGGSLYTLVQNILLACTSEGLGSALTTLLAAEQPAADSLLGVPDGYALGALIAVGWPVREKQYTKLYRKPVDKIAYRDRWDVPFTVEEA